VTEKPSEIAQEIYSMLVNAYHRRGGANDSAIVASPKNEVPWIGIAGATHNLAFIAEKLQEKFGYSPDIISIDDGTAYYLRTKKTPRSSAEIKQSMHEDPLARSICIQLNEKFFSQKENFTALKQTLDNLPSMGKGRK
jgi:hypothetical protein